MIYIKKTHKTRNNFWFLCVFSFLGGSLSREDYSSRLNFIMSFLRCLRK